MPTKRKIAIVDDHKLFATALAELVSQNENYEIFGIYHNGEDMKNKLRHSPTLPDLILMDVNMPKMNGKESTEWLKNNLPKIKVLALSMNNSENDIIAMLRAGAKGYILKDVTPDELHDAMICILENGYYNNELSSKAMHQMILGKPDILAQLKDRELELLNHVCSEMTYKEIAEIMNLSPKTVDGYREELFQKLHVKSRIGLVLFAIKNNLIII
ncbi:MAG TPA: response regulator transcription factor [Saprospiraceae bacterium]|nr:response regulator transcription factor [Saprospiraceae bacterium]MCB9327579.1 response regulator transcription factor [Lewinellaceae bacterium]HPK10852.1 response regulator transcription factor [Saprospiraceae bacterium]HRX28973.1 response regulator transcription factor [Saprospiraceae bacterium]